MYSYIKGELAEKGTNYAVIDVQGVGYQIFISNNALEKIGNVGDIVKLYTYLNVNPNGRDNIVCLYGFLSREEKRMFELLISVSGIGAKSAIVTLSNIEPSKFALAIITSNVAVLSKIPGVGKKTAERMILELKDKIKTEEAEGAELPKEQITTAPISENAQEAAAALQILGYTKKEIDNAINHVSTEGVSVEEIIRKTLSLLS